MSTSKESKGNRFNFGSSVILHNMMVMLHLSGQLSVEISEHGATLASQDVIEEFSDMQDVEEMSIKVTSGNTSSVTNACVDVYKMLSVESMVRDKYQHVRLQKAIEDSVWEHHCKSS